MGWVVSFTPRPLYHQRKRPWYPLDRRLGGPQSQSGHGGEEKNSQPLPGLGHTTRSPVLYHWAIPAPSYVLKTWRNSWRNSFHVLAEFVVQALFCALCSGMVPRTLKVVLRHKIEGRQGKLFLVQRRHRDANTHTHTHTHTRCVYTCQWHNLLAVCLHNPHFNVRFISHRSTNFAC
jgi:hypothetical protein